MSQDNVRSSGANRTESLHQVYLSTLTLLCKRAHTISIMRGSVVFKMFTVHDVHLTEYTKWTHFHSEYPTE